MAQFTKKAIISTFLQLLSKHSLDKITVKDIVEQCGINRNTFYYYYRDIYDLIEDIFRIEIQNIRENLDDNASFYDELHLGVRLILENKTFITHIYHSRSKDVIEQYLYDVVDSFIQKFVEQKAVELNIKDKTNICLIYDWYRYSIIGVLLEWIRSDNGSDPEAFIRKVADVYESTISNALLSTQKP